MHKMSAHSARASVIAFGVLAFTSAMPAHAEWTGTNSSAWNDAANWSTGMVPAGTTVYINKITPNATVANGIAFSGMTQNLYIGSIANSEGSLTLLNGCVFQIQQVQLGSVAGATGSLRLESEMVAHSIVAVGSHGTGSLVVSGSSASLTLPATGSTNGYIQMGGYGGYGSLVVSNGAQVKAEHISIGNGKGSGELVVDAATVILAQDLTVVGLTGNVRVTVQNGGTITLGHDFDLGSFADDYAGILRVAGPGSRITNTDRSTIGYAGRADAVISNGGAYEAKQIWFGYYQGGEGVALVTGGATMTATEALILGRYGSGVLTVQDGGKISTPALVFALSTAPTGTLSQGILNIGGAVGEAAAAPGSVTADSVEFATNRSTINFNHTATDYVFDAAIRDGIYGNGTLNAVAGRTIFNKDHASFTGQITASTGIVQINGDMSNASASVLNGGTFEGSGRIGNLTNAGMLSPGGSLGTLTIAGNYTGMSGSVIRIETALGNDASPTDRLVIVGNASGASSVIVTNVGGTGAPTNEGIKIIDVAGASDARFTLAADYITTDGQRAVIAGAYAYTLHQNGVSNPSDGDWYLRSQMTPPGPQPEPRPAPPVRLHPGVPLYESFAQVTSLLNPVSTLQERVGNRYWAGQAQDAALNGNGAWARIDGSHASLDGVRSTSATSQKVALWTAQTGIDAVLHENTGRSLLVGSLIASYGQASSDVKSIYGRGTIDAAAYGIGAALTWYDIGGFYADAQAHYSWYDTDLKSRTTGRTEKTNGTGYALSLETGHRIAVGRGLSLTPQIQVIYANADFDSFKDSFGARVRLDRADSLKVRAGLSLDKEAVWVASDGTRSRTHIYAIANLYNEFLKGNRVDVSGVKFSNREDRMWGGVGLGGSYNWNNDQYSLYGKIAVRTSLQNFADSNTLSASLGFRARW